MKLKIFFDQKKKGINTYIKSVKTNFNVPSLNLKIPHLQLFKMLRSKMF
jgi:hypothetical protein